MSARPAETTTSLVVLSYNLWHAKAQHELASLVQTHDPDVVCIQESHAHALPHELGGLTLIALTPRNRLGVALYARTSRFEVEESGAFALSTSRHDRFVGGTDHRLVAARVNDKEAGTSIVLGSFHGTPFTDSNAFRRLQVDDAHRAMKQLGPDLPSMMAGDYNHPILLGMLRRHVKRQGYTLAFTATSTFHRDGNLMRGKFDLATAAGLDVVDAVTLPAGSSDHRPVLFTLKYSE